MSRFNDNEAGQNASQHGLCQRSVTGVPKDPCK